MLEKRFKSYKSTIIFNYNKIENFYAKHSEVQNELRIMNFIELKAFRYLTSFQF